MQTILMAGKNVHIKVDLLCCFKYIKKSSRCSRDIIHSSEGKQKQTRYFLVSGPSLLQTFIILINPLYYCGSLFISFYMPQEKSPSPKHIQYLHIFHCLILQNMWECSVCVHSVFVCVHLTLNALFLGDLKWLSRQGLEVLV